MAIFIVLLSVSFVSAVDTTDAVIADDDDDEEDLELDDSPYRHGELTSSEAAALADAPANGAANAAGSSDNAKTTGANTNATGNPLLVLLAAIAALGIYPISRRK